MTPEQIEVMKSWTMRRIIDLWITAATERICYNQRKE